jgi:hypothetical protein
MQQRIVVCGLIWLASSLVNVVPAVAQRALERLRPDEYDTVAVIFNQELSAVGERALYPICIDAPPGTPLKPLIRYLRRDGHPISDLSVCNPGMGSRGHHPKDYPHGMQIGINKLRRASEGQLDIRVETADLTLRPGAHFVTLLRRGTYHFKQNQKGEWEITGYTKEYDFKDAETRAR